MVRESDIDRSNRGGKIGLGCTAVPLESVPAGNSVNDRAVKPPMFPSQLQEWGRELY